MIFAFVIYPFYVAKKNPELVNAEDELTTSKQQIVQFNTVKNIGEIVRESLMYISNNFTQIIPFIFSIVFPVSILLIALRSYYLPQDLFLTYWFDWAGQLEFMLGYGFYHWVDYVISSVWLLLFTLICIKVCHQIIRQQANEVDFLTFLKAKFFIAFLSTFLTLFPIFLLPWNYLIIYFFVFPFFVFKVIS
jgi:heme exporter protein D